MIYFIHAPALNAVKIGVASDPCRRLQMLQTGSPCPLHIVAIIDGGAVEERGLHARFAAHRTTGEWFEMAGEVEEFVSALPPYAKPVRDRTIRELGKASGMSISYISMIKSGGRYAPVPAILHLFKTTGWKHPAFEAAGTSDEQLLVLSEQFPWKAGAV